MTTNLRGEEDELLGKASAFLATVDGGLAQKVERLRTVEGQAAARELAGLYKQICHLRESGDSKLAGMDAYRNVFRPLWELHVPGLSQEATGGRFSGFALLHIPPSITELAQILYETARTQFNQKEFDPTILLTDDPRRGIPYTLFNFSLRTRSANEGNTLYEVAFALAAEYAKVGSTGLVKYLTDTSDMLGTAYDQKRSLGVAIPNAQRSALEDAIHKLIRYNPHVPELRRRMSSDTLLYPVR